MTSRLAMFAAVLLLQNVQSVQQQSPRVPPRDPRQAAPTGTASIRGRVFAADNKRPLRRARITVTAPELGGDNRTTSTNADGKYEIKELPAGRYTITVNRSGYLPLRYGQRRPFEQGKPLELLDRQAVDNIDFTLSRMSVITGRVFDETNEPMAGVRVLAMRTLFFEGRRRLVPTFGPLATTDDAGQYRVTGLAPGSYFVVADSRETWTVTEGDVDQVMGYSPTYFPGSTNLTDAKRVTVGIGREASNIDLSLIPGRAITLAGTTSDSTGRPLSGRNVLVRQSYRGPVGGMFSIIAQSTVQPDGAFKIRNLPPGEYQLQVMTTTEVNGAAVAEGALMPIAASGVDITDISLMTSAGWSFSGAITTETGEAPSAPRDRVRVSGRVLNPDTNPGPGSGPAPPPAPGGGPGGALFGAPDSGRVKDDWTFVVGGLFGPVQVRVALPDGWAVKSIFQDGRDVTDSPIEMRGGEQMTGVQIVLTNKVSTLVGQLADDKGAPLADGTVIVFADDAEKWSEDSRYVRAARPDQQGRYEIKGLPAGDYLAVAVDYVEDGMWNDPEYLESIRQYGRTVNVTENGTHTIALKLVTTTQ
jgi:carboxypeptidase family protein